MSEYREQAVIVRCAVSGSLQLEQLHELERELIAVIDAADVGGFDGNEVSEGQLVLYMYRADAEALLAIVASVLSGHSLTKGGTVTVRRGPPGGPERLVLI